MVSLGSSTDGSEKLSTSLSNCIDSSEKPVCMGLRNLVPVWISVQTVLRNFLPVWVAIPMVLRNFVPV